MRIPIKPPTIEHLSFEMLPVVITVTLLTVTPINHYTLTLHVQQTNALLDHFD